MNEPKGIITNISKWIEHTKHYIHIIADNHLNDTEVGDVLTDAINLSGKMIRPKLLLLSSCFGSDTDKKYDRLCMLAAMVELTHLASLIHDDIVDEAAYRRGNKTLQNRYGKDAAVYAGDFLMARIYYYEAVEHLNEPAALLSKAVENMCMGEIGQALCRYDLNTTKERYFKNIYGKTAALFSTAAKIGAMEAGCDRHLTDNLSLLGENIGYMLQLRDDLLDFTSDYSTLGKETHKDFKSGIYTMPVIMAMKSEMAKNDLLPIIKANKNRDLTEYEIIQMEELVDKYGGINATCDEIRKLAHQSYAILDTLDSKNEAMCLIKDIINMLEV